VLVPRAGRPVRDRTDGTADTDRWNQHASDDSRLSGRFASSDTAELTEELRWGGQGFCENATIPLIAHRVQVANEEVIAADTRQRLAGGSLGIGGALGGSGDPSCKPYEIIGVRGSGER
jgi:hypothetical protein